MSDAEGALALLSDLRQAKLLLADKGYDADWFREALEGKGSAACIPAGRGRKNPASHDRTHYKQRHRIGISIAGAARWMRISKLLSVAAASFASWILRRLPCG